MVIVVSSLAAIGIANDDAGASTNCSVWNGHTHTVYNGPGQYVSLWDMGTGSWGDADWYRTNQSTWQTTYLGHVWCV
jgi:hypothetical protein